MMAARASRSAAMRCLAAAQVEHIVPSPRSARHMACSTLSHNVLPFQKRTMCRYGCMFSYHIQALPCMRQQTAVVRSVKHEAPTALSPDEKGLMEVVFTTGFSTEQLKQLQDYVSHYIPVVVVALTPASYGISMASLLATTAFPDPPVHQQADSAFGRMILITGNNATPVAVHFNDMLAELGQPPAIIAAKQPRHDDMMVEDVLHSIRETHRQYYGLCRPLAVLPEPLPPTEAEVVMNVAMDAGRVPTPEGALREDVSHLVVLDGLCDESEREGILRWLTSADHDHEGPPPEDKWEMGCVDRTGDNPTWGLKAEVLQGLQDTAPQEVLRLQTKLATLYPEWDIAYLPASAMSETGDLEDSEALSSFVGNAVMAGDPCHWHVDADPSTIPPESPWVQHYGWYVNREPGRPLFVSAVLYLNEEWPEDLDAETLFLDPASQAGVFVRPSPGRLVLMDQDMTHRISSPSQLSPGPRYSLVWKLMFFPRSGNTAGSISRPEWGPPVRLGSAVARVPAYKTACTSA